MFYLLEMEGGIISDKLEIILGSKFSKWPPSFPSRVME